MTVKQLTISGLIDHHAMSIPTREAIASPEGSAWSYSRLSDLLSGLGEQLRQHGVYRTHRLAIVMYNGPEMALAVVATACVAIAAPINPANRYKECLTLLQTIGATALVVIAGANLPAVSAARKLGLPIIELIYFDGDLRVHGVAGTLPSSENSVEIARSSDVALLLHTSGSPTQRQIRAKSD